jgi:RHS repeat-associated protein
MVKQYLYGIGGQGLTITDGSGNLMSGETYFGGRYAGASTHPETLTQTPSGFIYAYADGLGSEHVLSNGEKDTNWPFGEFPNFQNGVSPVHFTGKPYDSETGLDYFGARYYAPALGRFLTPDWSATPEAIPYANLANPQSLNLYIYVLNNPATATDPDGHWCILGWGSTCSKSTKLQPKESGVAGVAGTDALTGGLDTTAILDGLKALGDAATVNGGEFAVVFSVINSPGDADPELLAREKAQEKRDAQPASEKTAKDMAAQIERDLGKEARRDFHDAKGPGAADRTLGELKQDAEKIYEEHGKVPPRWMRPGGTL